VLVFDDGSEFRGELLAVTRDDVVWQRQDANAPLRFPRSTVRRIVATFQEPHWAGPLIAFATATAVLLVALA